ncbi:Hypothetical_protein [Hexamita inflata]|uniref:Hypothetical_protein n=1 Tax=Hexamita inflata TaxID=28002 RepID=A0AA86VIP6_9EUKA|nr:Hypothetical protein HINF_LOCUS55443 [Hexamita inflata]
MILFTFSFAQVCRKQSKTTGLQYVCGENTACDSKYNCIRDLDQTICNTQCAAAHNTAGSCINTNLFHMNTYPHLDNPTVEPSVYCCPSTNIFAPLVGQKHGIN